MKAFKQKSGVIWFVIWKLILVVMWRMYFRQGQGWGWGPVRRLRQWSRLGVMMMVMMMMVTVMMMVRISAAHVAAQYSSKSTAFSPHKNCRRWVRWLG